MFILIGRIQIKVHPVKINNTNNVSKVNRQNAPEIRQVVEFHERFNYADIEPEEYNRLETDKTAELLREILFSLIKRCVFLGLDVRHDRKKSMGDYVLEARFEPPNKMKEKEACIYIPIEEVDDLIAKRLNGSGLELERQITQFVDRAMQQLDNPALIRLIIVAAHELGHFISFCSGNHDRALADGIALMHKGDVIGMDAFTSLVFIEEVIAWDHAKSHLSRYNFVWWEVFTKIKLDSLKAYYRLLQLQKASVARYARLSMIDEFRLISESNYFVKTQSV